MFAAKAANIICFTLFSQRVSNAMKSTLFGVLAKKCKKLSLLFYKGFFKFY